MKTED